MSAGRPLEYSQGKVVVMGLSKVIGRGRGAALGLGLLLGLGACEGLPEAPGTAPSPKAAMSSMLAQERAALARLDLEEEARPRRVSRKEVECLAKAIYFEARGEPDRGRRAVAEVVLNRVDDERYPDTICGVVYQGNSRGCQFSWTCNGKDVKPRNKELYRAMVALADRTIRASERPVSGGATHFHTRRVSPRWAKIFPRTTTIGAHHFYRQPGAEG